MNLVQTLMLCANGDGELSQPERDWVIGHATSYHPEMNQSQIDELRNYQGTDTREDEDIEKLVFSDPLAKKGRYVLVYEAIQACAADGDYNAGEKAYLRKMARKLGISEAKVQELENLFEEEKAFKEKRIKICYPEGIPGND